MKKQLHIHEDIRKAATLPAAFYRDSEQFETVKERIFARSWQWVADGNVIEKPQQVYPFTFLEGVLDEPLLLTCDKQGKAHCLSNVCTHRGKIIVEKAGTNKLLSCGYHGRCFHLDGAFKSMPEFKEVENFPTKADNLHAIPLEQWMNMFFISLDPVAPFEEMIAPIKERLAWLPLEEMIFAEEGTKDYLVDANWALYIDNYLEGFHIPFVHPALNEAIVFEEYDYELFPYANLQLGIAKEGEPCFDIPKSSPDAGKNIYAYYWWLFPNLMFNVYPWGVSLNVIEPLSHNRTRVRFRTYRFPNVEFNRTVNNLEDTEMEDEAVVESVQKGIQSRFYQSGRFSPKMEQGVHHFHRLIQQYSK